MKKKKIKIGITGNIGSGKSVFSKLIEEQGYKVIYADELSKEILDKDKNVRKKVIELFGTNSYIKSGVNSKYIAEKVFQDYNLLKALEKILHPIVINKSEELLNHYLDVSEMVFLEAALIYEADMEKYFDYIVLITADKKIRFERKQSSSGMNADDFEKRDLMQIAEDEKKKRADFIFENNSDLNSLKQKALLLITLLKN